MELRSIERQERGKRTHTRVAPSPRGRLQNLVLRLMTIRRGRSPKPATRADIGQQLQDR